VCMYVCVGGVLNNVVLHACKCLQAPPEQYVPGRCSTYLTSGACAWWRWRAQLRAGHYVRTLVAREESRGEGMLKEEGCGGGVQTN